MTESIVCNLDLTDAQGLGAAKDAIRMARIVKFYEKLPKGPAPERATSGLLGRYQNRYFGKNPSAARKLARRDPEQQGLTEHSDLARYLRSHGIGLQHGVLFPPEYVKQSMSVGTSN
jgi:hypothetical protein